MAQRIPLDLALFESNLDRLRAQIARLAPAAPPRIVIVSKYLSPEDCARLTARGHRPLGENRAEDLVAKASSEGAHAWHFIGHLQRNKLSRVLPRIELLHSLDSERLAASIDAWLAKQTGRSSSTLDALVQVNVSHEHSKGGLDVDACRAQLRDWCERFRRVRLVGLMTMAPAIDAEECRRFFRELRELRDEIADNLGPSFGEHFRELSMGMSNDYRVAVEEGATLVRLGTSLYVPPTAGDRPPVAGP